MFLKGIRAHEEFSSLRAFIGFLTEVYLFMSLKAMQIRQGCLTLLTDTDIFSTVISFTSLKAAAPNESFVTLSHTWGLSS
jgi:hypothetical protein